MTTVRWREFEREVADLFVRAGFQVDMNAKAAHPRQTDVYASDDTLRLLIEAKSRKRTIDVGDIDSLRARLNRTRPDVIGAIFAISGLSRTAKGAIEADRKREILTFVGSELEQLRRGRQNIRALIEQKRESLAVHGKVWQSSEHRSRHSNVQLPSSNAEFWIGQSHGPYFESRSGLSGAFYALRITDTGWGTVGGEGARLAIQLALNDVQDLRDLLAYLHKTFGLSKNGMFSIHQSQSCWHGMGAHNFIEAVGGWRQRYAQSSSKTIHHSEELGYFDNFYTGWIQISAQQRIALDDATREPFLHHAEVVIQLPGVPVDMSRFLRLCQYANNDWSHFEYVHERWTTTRRLKTTRQLHVVGKVVAPEPSLGEGRNRTVIGLIARNPYYQKSSLPRELGDADGLPLHQLLESELLLCDLRDWHSDGCTADYYKLQGFEVTEGGTGPIIRPFGTWNRLLKGRRQDGSQEPTGQDLI